MDYGLELIDPHLREACWNRVLLEQSEDPWELYAKLIIRPESGGASSLGEAQRLFWAEQIGRVHFLVNGMPSTWARQLSEDIQNGFQNNIRPITSQTEPTLQLIEILAYYFPTETAQNNFELALDRKLDDIVITKKCTKINPTEHKASPNFEEKTQRPKRTIEEIAREERPLLREYINLRRKGQDAINISPRLKEILDDFLRNELS